VESAQKTRNAQVGGVKDEFHLPVEGDARKKDSL